MKIEQWKHIAGTRVEVSDQGNFRYLKTMAPLPQRKILKGYLAVAIHRKGRFSHRLVAINFIPNPGEKKTVNHINGVKTDNRVENLEWATHSENNRHAHRMGLNWSPALAGIKNGRAILTNKMVQEILLMRSEGKKLKEIAKCFPVKIGAIQRVTAKTGWTNRE